MRQQSSVLLKTELRTIQAIQKLVKALKQIIAPLLLLVLPLTAHARDLLGLEIGTTFWQSTLQAGLQTYDFVSDSSTVSATRFSASEMGISDSINNTYHVKLDTKLPVLPKFEYEHGDITFENNASLARQINFAQQSLASGEDVNVSYDLSYRDIRAFYSIKKGWFDLQIGASKRSYSGDIVIRSILEDTSTDAGDGDTGDATDGGTGDGEGQDAGEGTTDATSTGVPSAKISPSPLLLYSGVEVEFPGYAFKFTHSLHYKNGGNEHFSDRRTGFMFEFDQGMMDLIVSAGYRKNKLIFTDDTIIDSNLVLAGPYFSISIAL